jgi:DNA-binding MarR family transcriptional regulator
MKNSVASRRRNAWQLAHQVHRELSDLLARDLEQTTGLALREYEALAYLSRAPGENLPLADLADGLLLSPTAATRFCDRLELSGLIKRRRGRADRRAIEVRLTVKGRKTFAEANAVYNTQVGRHFGQHLTAEEATVLNTSLDKVLAALRARRSPAP